MSAWLIDTVLYTGVLIGLVLGLRRPVGRFFGPQFAYALWALPFLRLLLPPIVLPASLAPEPALGSGAPTGAWPSAVVDIPAEAVAANVAVAPPPPPPAWEWADIFAPAVSIWAGVALAFLAWRVITYRRMRAELLTGARPVGEIGRIRLVETPALAAPVAFGVLDKVIALPPLFMAQHDIVARDLAIQHEFAHHKGHDLLANFAAQALLALHWFNPLAWYGWRAMRRDQEAACDARVLAGRGHEERIRYAALIAGIATGPRSIAFERALAAPMACPVLGERSIVHRLRSISMSETSRRRRWLGRTLYAAGALALPLTASISYAAADADTREPAKALTASSALAAAHPVALAGPSPRTGSIAATDDGAARLHPHPDAQIAVAEGGDVPPMPQFHGPIDPMHPEWQSRMEAWGREMEEWGARWGEQWGEQHRDQALALAETHRERAMAQGERQRERALARAEQQRERALALAERQREGRDWADAARHAPEVVESCDEGEARRTTTADGRPRVVICQREITEMVRSSLRTARESIARNTEMSAEVRRDVLRDLDEEIEELDRETN